MSMFEWVGTVLIALLALDIGRRVERYRWESKANKIFRVAGKNGLYRVLSDE